MGRMGLEGNVAPMVTVRLHPVLPVRTPALSRASKDNRGRLTCKAARVMREARSDESVTAIYSSAGGHLAVDGGHFACGVGRVHAASPVGAAASRLSDDPGDDV